MASKVYYYNLRTRTDRGNKINKLRSLYEKAGFGQMIHENDLSAIKLHFGEKGNDGYLNPVFVRAIADCIKESGGKPFLTDTNTLYSGSRHNAVDHLITALEHGFDYTVTGAPLIISDGLKSDNIKEVEIGGKHFSKVNLAGDIVSADSMIVMSHFKAHEMAGFGGAIKNLAMGGAPVRGKMEQHSTRMFVKQDECIGCGKCRSVCPVGAVTLEAKKAEIDKKTCIGCGECMTVCPKKAIDIDWATGIVPFMERMTEYALGVVRSHQGRIGYMNLLINITPDCDCTPWSDAPIVPDIGFLASDDPVAIDQASYDLVNAQMGNRDSLLESGMEAGDDKFIALRSFTAPTVQLSYGQEIGLGSRDYELITL